MYISFYITDPNNVLIFEYLLNPVAPSFNELYSKLQNGFPDISQNNQELDDYENVNSNGRYINCRLGKDLDLYRYCSSTNKLYIWCLVSGRKVPQEQLIPFLIMEEVEKSLLAYFEKDELSTTKLINNYDRISLIFYWLFDGGEPAVGKRYYNTIRDIVPKKFDFSKAINSTAHNIQIALQKSQEQKNNFSYLDKNFDGNLAAPWRSENVEHLNNELYVDMVESLQVVLELRDKKHSSRKSSMKIITGNIVGKASVRSFLNGNPIVELKLDIAGNELGTLFMHDCIDLKCFNDKNNTNETKTFKFLPPDGYFTLFDYELDLDNGKHFSSNNNKLGIITASFEDEIGMKHDEFQLTLNISNSREIKSIQCLEIELIFSPKIGRLEEGVIYSTKEKSPVIESNKSCDIVSELDKRDYKIKMLRSSHGRFENTLKPNKCLWIFDKETNVGITPVLTGCIEYNNTNKKMHLSNIMMKYSYNGELPSNMKVKSLEIVSGLGNTKGKTLFKGAKYTTKINNYKLRSTK